MVNVRNLLSAIALMGLMAITLLAAAQSILMSGAGGQLSTDELIDALATRDLAQEPPSRRLALARQFERDSAQGTDWQSPVEALPPEARKRYLNNLGLLMRVALMAKVDRYFALDEGDRDRYLDEQIDNVLRWPIVAQAAQGSTAPARPPTLEQSFKQLQSWQGQFSPDDRRRLNDFAGAAYRRWLVRKLRPLAPGM